MKQLDQITRTIRQAVKESINKEMSLQSAKALAAKIMGERNLHAAVSKPAPTAQAMLHGGFTWHVVGHYHDNGQPFTTLVRAKDGFSALLEVTHRLLQEANGVIDNMPDLILHRALNAFTGEIAHPSDEDSLDGAFVQDLVEHLEGFEPFSLTHQDLPQEHNLEPLVQDGRIFVGMAYTNPRGDFEMPTKIESILAPHVDAPKEQSVLEKEFARIDALGHWEDDPLYSHETWSFEVACNDTRQSYKEWVKTQYEMNQGQ